MEAQTPPSSSDHPPITMTQHPPAKTLASATHPYGPAASNHSLRPSPGPSFKDLLRRTRSPLHMTHQKPTALFSKKAGSLPIRFFSWSAAASLGMLATFSFDAPVQAQACLFPSHVKITETTLSVDNGTILPSCNVIKVWGQGIVTSIDLSGLSSLHLVEVWENSALTSIDLSGLSFYGSTSIAHRQIRIDRNRALTSIDLSDISGLKQMAIRHNPALTSIDLSSLSSLDLLTIGANGALMSIDLSDLSSLDRLGIWENSALTSIDFPRVCNNLIEVVISDNDNFPDLSLSEVKERCEEENRPPIRTSEPFSITRRVNLDVTRRNQQTFNLDKYFTDPDGNSLTYTASTDRDTVRVEVRGNTLYLIANSVAIIPPTITVTASDGKGGTVSDTFKVKITINELSDATQEIIEEALVESAILIGKEIATGKAKAKAIEKIGKIAKATPKVIEAVKKGESIIDAINNMLNAGNSNSSDSGPSIESGPAEIKIGPSSSSNNNINKTINNLTEALYLNHDALEKGYISLDQAFSGQDFSVPFNLSQAFSQDQRSSPRFNALLNANIGFSRFSDSSDPDLSIDGTTTNYGIGLTLIPNPEVPLVTGLQFGYTRSNSDFEHPDTEGTYDLRMFSVHPFIGWDATDSLTVWSVIGYGRPNDEITIESVNSVEVDPAEDSTFTSSGDFFSFAGGANYRVWQSNLSALSIGLSGSTTSLLDNDSQQGSISAKFSHKFPFDAGQLKTSADLALILSDSGPSATELSGQLDWLPNQGRLSGSTNARLLLFGGDRSEWGIGGSVVLLPGERGEGLSLALQPSFGQTNPALSNLHLDPFSFSDPTELALSTAPLTARFNAELAYGFPTGNHALLTPYIDASLAHSSNTYTTGLRYHLDSGLDLDLSASHRTRSSGNNDNRFFLQLRSDL